LPTWDYFIENHLAIVSEVVLIQLSQYEVLLVSSELIRLNLFTTAAMGTEESDR